MTWMDFVNTVISCSAWVFLILTCLRPLILPAFIGKKRDPVDPLDCSVAVVFFPIHLACAGRLLGWW